MLRVLHLARNYPNNVLPRLGLWTHRLVHSVGAAVEQKVVAPVPYWPPVPGLPRYARFRAVERQRMDGDVEVLHPRFLTGPGYLCHSVESATYYVSVKRTVDAIRDRFPFDLIHAHFIYPEGVVAVPLGWRYGVPVVVTEQAPWRPWLDQYPLVRRQAVWAARRVARHMALSRSLRDEIVRFTGLPEKVCVVPNIVDTSHFVGGAPRRGREAEERLLFVGVLRYCKGLDVLFEALRVLLSRGRKVRLTVIGDAFYESYRREAERLRQMVVELELRGVVDFVGGQPPVEVARQMRESHTLVLPSRAESFGVVLVEALACGIPVVATRSGGPEDIVTEDVGILVPPGDAEALARGLERVLDNLDTYDAGRLSQYARERFGPEPVGRRIRQVYQAALSGRGPGAT